MFLQRLLLSNFWRDKIILQFFDYNHHQNQYVGVKTPLDNVQLETNDGSLNPMDTDWCGHRCTQKALDGGRFEGRTRKILNPIDDKLKNSPRTN